jgi:membrane protease YdiL (CAAX protease family)
MGIRSQAGQVSWRNRRSTQLLAVVVGVLPVYAFALWFHLTRRGDIGSRAMLIYPMVLGGGSIILILLLLRFLCGARLRDLELKPGRFWLDFLLGVILFVVLALLAAVEQFTLARIFPSRANPAFARLMHELASSPLLLAVWLGPVVWIGVAGFEELSRVFLLNRLWKVWPGTAAHWLVIVSSAAVFGLVHLYQGPTGVISTGIIGFIAAWFYMSFGRIWPLIISHAIYDSAWIIVGVMLFNRGLM